MTTTTKRAQAGADLKESDMNTINRILKQLPGLKTSDDFDAALAELEREHTEAVAAVGELATGREAAIFGDGDLAI